MRTIVSAAEMRWCDEATINTHGIPGILLMEHAGSGVAAVIGCQYGPIHGKHILIFCGKGNNGGDGFVIARLLLNKGASVEVVLLTTATKLEGDARTNFAILARLARAHSNQLQIHKLSPRLLPRLKEPELIVDSIFGTGFTGEVKGSVAKVVDWINAQSVPVVSVDIPSGVNGTTGVAASRAICAERTVTFGLLKTGLLCNQGQDLAGAIHLVDIGIPPVVQRSKKLKTFLTETCDVKSVLPQRASTAHKYSVGKVLVIAGSKGFTGAAYLCAKAALRAGAGAVMLATPETVYPILAKRLTEAIVTSVTATKEGTLGIAALPALKEKLEWADVVVVGPGLSTHAETLEVIKQIIAASPGKIVVDADALRVVAELGLRKCAKLKGEFVLTPHAGELSRIVGTPSAQIEADRVEVSRASAMAGKLALVLKGGPTATGLPDGRVFVNSTGNPGMATVGSGDVLAGMIASLWAQGMSREDAAVSGVYLHGLAGDCAKECLGERSIVAHDLIDHLPAAIGRIESP
jgi:NAD(P)H-hydrate epimerase